MMKNVSRAPILFFDSNPLGRIINRFSKDVAVLDTQLPLMYLMFLLYLGQLFVTLIMSVIVLPPMLGVLGLLAGAMFYVKRKATVLTNESLKWDAITRSPINSLFSATLRGLMTIRAFRQQDFFLKSFLDLVDKNGEGLFTYLGGIRWLAMMLDLLIYLYAIMNVILSVVLSFWLPLKPSQVAMSISLILQMGGTFQEMVRIMIQIENSTTCVQRIREYIQLPSEAAVRCNQDQDLMAQGWPTQGAIEFKNLSLRYRSDFNPVLNNLSFQIKGREKIGIVGRTGAGKSSLLSALFRLVEKDEIEEGGIYIDGIDTSTIGLSTLREALAIIPQSPFLFAGTIRQNLDPIGVYSTEEIEMALQDVQLASFVSSGRCSHGLETYVSDASSLFSNGQRQLMCLARAILRRAKILVLDEATANVDMETDEQIQRTIRTRFVETTVLTIAHRLATIIDSNRVLVIGEGRVLEFDHPYLLLVKNQGDSTITRMDSYFAEMVQSTGMQSAQMLLWKAKEHYTKK